MDTAASTMLISTVTVAVTPFDVISCHSLTGSVCIRYPSSLSSPL